MILVQIYKWVRVIPSFTIHLKIILLKKYNILSSGQKSLNILLHDVTNKYSLFTMTYNFQLTAFRNNNKRDISFDRPRKQMDINAIEKND